MPNTGKGSGVDLCRLKMGRTPAVCEGREPFMSRRVFSVALGIAGYATRLARPATDAAIRDRLRRATFSAVTSYREDRALDIKPGELVESPQRVVLDMESNGKY
jgi:hypothetical protein